MLARPASKITLRDIVVELEGPLSIVECVRTPSVCHRNALCVARDVWADVSAKIENALKSITLKDIVASYKEEICISQGKEAKGVKIKCKIGLGNLE